MKTQKFAIGQTVRFSPGLQSSAKLGGSYKIVRLLPAEANDYQYRVKNDYQYRVKSVADGHERVVKESQLS